MFYTKYDMAILQTFCPYFVCLFVSYFNFKCLRIYFVSFYICQLLRSYGQIVLFS